MCYIGVGWIMAVDERAADTKRGGYPACYVEITNVGE
jgi:hypothetical protein